MYCVFFLKMVWFIDTSFEPYSASGVDQTYGGY